MRTARSPQTRISMGLAARRDAGDNGPTMPNGWYSVPGLNVVLIQRNEQRYPRLEWDQYGSHLWIVQLTQPSGFSPYGRLDAPHAGPAPVSFDVLVEAAARLCAEDPKWPGSASVALLDFEGRRGAAVGSFWVYGFHEGGVSILLDMSLRRLAREIDPSIDADSLPLIPTTWIDASGIKRLDKEASDLHFSFPDVDALVLSNVALHEDAHWPPKTSLDCVMMALARPPGGDLVVALWKPREARASGAGD
jgi:hypothetical protein